MRISGPARGSGSPVAVRELDHRAGDGLDVRLLWNAETKDVLVSVAERDGIGFEFPVRPTDALDAFHHPYAYAAHTAAPMAFAA